MRGKWKVQGMVLAAVLALSAVAATAAHAGTHEIELEAGNATAVLTGTSDEGTKTKVTIQTLLGAGTVECHTFLSATVQNGAKAVTLHPEATECKAFGEAAVVTTDHCDYVLTEGATSAEGHAPVTVNCADEESFITVSIPSIGCTLDIGTQHELKKGVHYTNVETGGKMEITAHVTLENVKLAHKTGSCGLITGNVATMTATVTIKAYEDKGSPLSGTEATTPNYTEGAQIGVTTKEV